MAIRVGINGFGRIGRCVLRAGWNDPEIEFVHINDLTSPEMLAHLLTYDSVHRTWAHCASAVEGGIQVGDKLVPISAEPDPSKLPWKDVDVVLECAPGRKDHEQVRRFVAAVRTCDAGIRRPA